LSTLYIIYKGLIFDVTKITRFWRSTHNANSPLYRSFLLTLSQTDYVHKILCIESYLAKRESRDLLFSIYTNGYLERSSASVTSFLSHCSL